jgi:G3E family GTPase
MQKTIKTFWVGEDMLKVEANLRIIYSVVGAHIFEKNLENEIFVRQLLFADLILLNQIVRI